MINLKYSIGIDVSKKDFHCCLSIINSSQKVTVKSSRKFSNTSVGFRELLAWIKQHKKEDLPLRIVMEATGVYHEQLAWFVHSNGLVSSILLPNKAKKYLQADGLNSKNDSIDARGLAKIGAEKNLEPWIPGSEKLYELRQYTRQHQNLKEAINVIGNQLEALHHGQFQSKEVTKQLNKTIRLLEKQVTEMEKSMENLIRTDRVLNLHYKNITSIKGVSLLSFCVVVAETNGFTLFKSSASLVKYSGYDVIENQSGKHVGKTRISKKGNPRIRRILFMPAFCAVRDDQPQFKNLYERVVERTGFKMKGYVAVQKKLLVMMYHLWKNEQQYNPQFNSEEKIIAPEKSGATHDKIPEGSFH
ncbi:MAG: IS110 family transposase [Pedobacter sp.]|nr:MAG: IS110 family transposase [Pedobacter sp.]